MDDSEIVCRICLETCERYEVIAPCRCSGSSKWVHRECLDKWRSTREDKAFSKCTECLASYELVAPESSSREDVRARQLRFSLLVWRDLGTLFIVVHVPVLLCALIAFGVDAAQNYHLAAYLHLDNSSDTILCGLYYLLGWLMVLEALGLAFVCAQCCCGAGLFNTDSTLNVSSVNRMYDHYVLGIHNHLSSQNHSQNQDQTLNHSRNRHLSCSECVRAVCGPCCCFACTGTDQTFYADHQQHYDRVAGAEESSYNSYGTGASQSAGMNRAVPSSATRNFARGRSSGGNGGCVGCCCEPSPRGNTVCWADPCLYYPVYGGGGHSCEACCCCCDSCATGGAADGAACCDLHACCAGGDACSCLTSAELGQECAVLFLLVAVVLVVVGVFVVLYLGGVLLESMLARHIHVLQKRTLVDHYQVRDLAANDDITKNPLVDGTKAPEEHCAGVEMSTLPPQRLSHMQQQELEGLGLLADPIEEL